jgi:hypothetical protein
MIRYWFEFEVELEDLPFGVKMGCGVTAYNSEDALYLISNMVFKGHTLPAVKIMIENIDLTTLDAGHVLPNMSPPNVRGIWFPLGYD